MSPAGAAGTGVLAPPQAAWLWNASLPTVALYAEEVVIRGGRAVALEQHGSHVRGSVTRSK